MEHYHTVKNALLVKILGAFILLAGCLPVFSAAAGQGGVAAPVAQEASPEEATIEFQVPAALLVELDSNDVLYAQNPEMEVPPASLTKIMSLYVLFDAIEKGEISLLDRVKVSAKADRTGGSSMGALTNHFYPRWEIMKGMAVASGNDASQAAAETFPGGYDVFIARMNETAKALGMTGTHFVNPHGLPAKKQIITARDMLVLAQDYLRRFPQALRLHSMPFSWHGTTKTRNRNRLLGSCSGVDGLKTGYVRASGYNTVITAKRDGVRLVAVLLGATSPKVRAREGVKLLEYGFGSVTAHKNGGTRASESAEKNATEKKTKEAL